jgi:tetratricopeptide (TPR) repeat protein
MRIVLAIALLAFAGCDRMITPRSTQSIKDAEAKANVGDYASAITLYEAALDGTAKTADIHYRLAVLYDDKLNDPLNALHHFKRFVALTPNGAHANDAKNFMKRDELAVVTQMSGDSVVPRAEAARLKNENLTLRRELDEARARTATTAASAKKPSAHPTPKPGTRKSRSRSSTR